MTTRLPLVARAAGIWMAERLSTLPGAWAWPTHVELRGALATRRCWEKRLSPVCSRRTPLSLRFEGRGGGSLAVAGGRPHLWRTVDH